MGSSPDGSVDAATAAAVFDAMPVLMVAAEGPDHRLVAANQVYRSFAARPDILGKPAREAFPDIAGQHLFELLDQVYRTGEAVTAREWRLETAGPSGPLEFFMDFTVAPWPRPDGSVRGVLITQSDVTERVSQRRAAEDSQRRFEAARDVITRLQEALLPNGLPILPGLDLAAGYLVAEQEQAAGGDWFDVVLLRGGRVALVVGDVVGHGVTASATMGRVRAVLAEVLGETDDLLESARRMDDLARRWPELRGTSVCVVVVDPADPVISFVTCGHPPPLVLQEDGGHRMLSGSGAGPLGTGSRYLPATGLLRPGEVLLLFSDGLVERPGRTLDAGLSTLARVAGSAMGSGIFAADAALSAPERVCRESIELLTRGGYHDDVTVLAAQVRRQAVVPLAVELPATVEAVTAVRLAARDWLHHVGVTRHDEDVLELAVTELVANAVEHAYGDGPAGPVRLEMTLQVDGVVEIRVADEGRWDPPTAIPAATSGRGLWMVGATADEIHVDHPPAPDGCGTRVRARLRLIRPVEVSPGPVVPDGSRQASEFATVLDEGPPRTLRISGSIDIVTAGAFADRLDVASRGGVFPVVVDLTDVDVLASAGLQVLFAARDRQAVHGHPLTIRALAGGIPGQVLDLVGLPYEGRPAVAGSRALSPDGER